MKSHALISIYALGAVIGIVSFFVSRGPDGHFTGLFVGFGVIAMVYLSLAWVTRHQAVGLHVGVHLVLYGAAVAFGMWPKPNLDEMAGFIFLRKQLL